MMRQRLALLLVAISTTALVAGGDQAPGPLAAPLELPNRNGSVKALVLGDTGTGGSAQYRLGEVMAAYRAAFPFEFAIMLGDNLYGGEKAGDFERKFERPYKPLLDAGVKFYAALGNHDEPAQRFYKPFNMGGERYYSFRKGNAQFFALDSNYMDPKQLDWLERELSGSGAEWKICFFHHPLYSSGARHGSEFDLRRLLEPLFLEHGVNVVFAGHEHFYERLKPQKGVYYFTVGGSAKLRRGNIRKTAMTEVGFDRDNSFLLAEIAGDELYFQTVTRTGKTIDSGALRRQKKQETNGTPKPVTQRSSASNRREREGAASLRCLGFSHSPVLRLASTP